METYKADDFAQNGMPAAFVQDNHSYSAAPGTVRGLHFQAPPRQQAKLIKVLHGAIYDVAVDIRVGSPTYGRWCGARLTADGGDQLFAPAGFAHGFCTLAQDTEVAYKCDAYYAPLLEGGVAATDPEIGIAWPFPRDQMILSEKDKSLPLLRDLVSPFAVAATGG